MGDRFLFSKGADGRADLKKHGQRAYQFMQANGRGLCKVDRRLHTDIADYVDVEVRKLVFSTGKDYLACQRHVMATEPWTHLVTAEIAESARDADIVLNAAEDEE